MLSDLVSIDDNDWDSVRQAHGAYARDLKRIFLSLGLGGGDMGGGVPKSANDQTVSQDGSYGHPIVTTDMLDDLEAAFEQAIANIPPPPVVTYPISIANGGTGQTAQQAAINALSGGVTNNRVLRGNGTNVQLAQVALTTDVSGALPIANGGTGSISAFNALIALGALSGTKATGSPWTSNASYTVPSGVRRIMAIIVGGGGGASGSYGFGPSGYYFATTSGGSPTHPYSAGVGGNGGGSGAQCIAFFDVTPGETLTITIGAAGSGAASSSGDGSAGGDTAISISGPYNITATGGGGGGAWVGGGFGGAGGSTTTTFPSDRNLIVLHHPQINGNGGSFLFGIDGGINSLIHQQVTPQYNLIGTNRGIGGSSSYSAGGGANGTAGTVAIFY